jgi:ABC-type nickel/cobalt efflux system permease component RcnA
VLGLILVFYGAFEIVQGLASRAVNPYRWLNLITGILLVLSAFWVSGSDRVYALARRTALILFWVGFFALFQGLPQIMLAFGVRHAGEEAAALDTAGPGQAQVNRQPERPERSQPTCGGFTHPPDPTRHSHASTRQRSQLARPMTSHMKPTPRTVQAKVRRLGWRAWASGRMSEVAR